jgi:hypothetical protein
MFTQGLKGAKPQRQKITQGCSLGILYDFAFEAKQRRKLLLDITLVASPSEVIKSAADKKLSLSARFSSLRFRVKNSF